jgi:hypothetical protein
MKTNNEQKEIEKLINKYSSCSTDRLKEILQDINKRGNTFGNKKRNALLIEAINTLLL